MQKIFNKNGMASMLEVVITTVIFTISAFGIFSTISMLQPQSAGSSQRLEAAYAGKAVLDQLREEVDASTWSTGGLTPGAYGPTTTPDGYTISYTVSDVTGLGLRRVDMTITWPDL